MTSQEKTPSPAAEPARTPLVYKPTLRAITLWQPWATLMAIGAKRYETRSWSTVWTGVCAIHAARAIPAPYRESVERIFYSDPVQKALRGAGLVYPRLQDMPNGILSIGRMTGCHRTNELLRTMIETERGRDEITFGDYTDDRYVHEHESMVALREPITARGFQQFWDVPESTTTEIARQLSIVFDRMHREIRTVLEPYTK